MIDPRVNSPFANTSRYFGLETAAWQGPDGRIVRYVRRRFVPAPEAFHVVREYVVAQGDRVDTIAAAQLGDPEQYWRVADANLALDPNELTDVPGRRIVIALPEGLVG
jgi:hypothetical protein